MNNSLMYEHPLIVKIREGGSIITSASVYIVLTM